MSMMKTSSKPISSPSRTDKFPTPLMMRFLRSNVGSRSRGRSRSSPMFIMRTKKNAAVIGDATQQEPSSPKVTCIGQVRARRSSKAKSSKSKRRRTKQVSRHPCSCSFPCPCPCPSSSSTCRCCCIPKKTRFCCRFSPKFCKPRRSFFRAFFRKWVLFFRCGYCKKIEVRDDSVQVVSIQRGRSHVSSAFSNAIDIEGDEGSVQETKEDFLESSCPPKNALLLTRCRSAPYRSSSLAGRFWGSPLGTSEAETEAPKDDEFKEPPDEGSGKHNSPNYGNEAVVEPRNNSSHEGNSEELDSSSNERTKEEVSIQNSRGGSGSIHPLLLTRCKSEPARTGERLNPEVNFTMQRRSDTTQSCLQQSNCD